MRNQIDGRAGEMSCQPNVLATSKFGALDRIAGGKCGSQPRIVRLAPHEPVTVRRQARSKTVLLRKMSHQLLQVGERQGDRDPPILRWDSVDAVHNERVLARS